MFSRTQIAPYPHIEFFEQYKRGPPFLIENSDHYLQQEILSEWMESIMSQCLVLEHQH